MDFLALRSTAHCRLLAAFDRCAAERDAAAEEEAKASLLIQTQLRRYNATKAFQAKRNACCEIERVFRGSRGRQQCRELMRHRRQFEHECLFHYYATVIQHVFRGFQSRRYRHDFYARKAYIENIIQKSNELRIQLAANRERAAQEEQERKLREMQEEFKSVATRLHHLLSTKSRPGVYNSPFAGDNKPTAFGIPVEDHLKNCTLELLRTQGMRAGHDEFKPRIKRSILASSEYGAHREAERAESRRSKTLRVSERNFHAGGKGPLTDLGKIPHISTDTVFVDQYKIQKSTRDQRLRYAQKPFHSAVPKNLLFDEIYDQVVVEREKKPAEP